MQPARIVPALLIAAGTALSVPAFADHQTVQALRIAVIDPQTNRELAVVAPEERIQLVEGEQRLLRVFGLREQHGRGTGRSDGGMGRPGGGPGRPDGGRPDDSRDRIQVGATFGFGNERTPIEIVRQNRDRGEVLLRVPNGARWDNQLHVGYRIDESVDLADQRMRLGRVLVDIVNPRASSADRIVAALYRAILLREPDAGAAARRDDIARNGWAAVERQARQIAESRESEIELYSRGVCNQQRLLAMYKELLGREQAQIDQRTWRAQLPHLERGDIAGVVEEMVESREFRDRFGMRDWPRRR